MILEVEERLIRSWDVLLAAAGFRLPDVLSSAGAIPVAAVPLVPN
jgi:phosphoribosylcarboxyaminoimidazole (NCAIR) mutase